MIDFKFIVGTLIKQRKKLVLFLMFFAILGVVIAQLSEDQYTSKSIFIPKGTTPINQKTGKLRSLASLAGVNLSTTAEEVNLSPLLYSKIISTVGFRQELANSLVTLPSSTKKVTYIAFYQNHYKPSILSGVRKYTLGLPKELLKLVRGKKEESTVAKNGEGEFKTLTQEERINIARLKQQISVNYSELNGYAELSAAMPDALMSAEMAKNAEAILQKVIIDHRLGNVREELKFTKKLLEEKKGEYEENLATLTAFQDTNQSINTASGLSRLQKIQADFDLAYSVYAQIASQYEQVKLQIAKDTPVFSIIEPVSVPKNPSAPRKPLIIIVFVFLGVLSGLAFIFGKIFIKKLKSQDFSDFGE